MQARVQLVQLGVPAVRCVRRSVCGRFGQQAGFGRRLLRGCRLLLRCFAHVFQVLQAGQGRLNNSKSSGSWETIKTGLDEIAINAY